MATNNQVQFIADLEGGVKHLKTDAHRTTPYTIGEVIDAAGRSIQELRPIVKSLAWKEDFLHLDRIKIAFKSLGLEPKCITDAYKPAEPEHEEELVLDPVMPPEPEPEPEAQRGADPELESKVAMSPKYVHVIYDKDPAESLSEVIKILAPLNARSRQRIVNSVSVYFGVGE